jgi:hypothetical protein
MFAQCPCRTRRIPARPLFDHLVGEGEQRLRMAMPTFVAVLLMKSSKLVGRSTGRAASIDHPSTECRDAPFSTRMEKSI